mmetsp:Transcript_10968/g.12537  ORF Transcript_10968/g.12537 Transcript_10968/m.12537 type:complete len:441 (-) Transcript_10968:340-1662(-)
MIRFFLAVAAAASISTHGVTHASTLIGKSIIDQAIEQTSECAVEGELGGTKHMSDLLHCPTTDENASWNKRQRSTTVDDTDTKAGVSAAGLCEIFGGTVVDGDCRVCTTVPFVDVEVCCAVSSVMTWPLQLTCDLEYPCDSLVEASSVKVTAGCELDTGGVSCSCTAATFNGEACDVCTLDSTLGPAVNCSNVEGGPDGLDKCINLCTVVNGELLENGDCEVCDDDVSEIEGVDGCCAIDVVGGSLSCDGCIQLDPEGEQELCGTFTCVDFGTDCSGSFDFGENDDELPVGLLKLSYGDTMDASCGASWDGGECNFCEKSSGDVGGAARFDCRNLGGRANIQIEEEVECGTVKTKRECNKENKGVCMWTTGGCVDFVEPECSDFKKPYKCKKKKGVCMWNDKTCVDFVKVDCPALVDRTTCLVEKKQCKWKKEKCKQKKL